MPAIDVLFFRNENGTIPFRDWVKTIPPKARARCFERIDWLRDLGHELRRPHAEYIEGTDLYELRIKHLRVNYRILYFFHGQEAAVVSHGFDKEDKIPPGEITRAAERMRRFRADPKRHTLG